MTKPDQRRLLDIADRLRGAALAGDLPAATKAAHDAEDLLRRLRAAQYGRASDRIQEEKPGWP